MASGPRQAAFHSVVLAILWDSEKSEVLMTRKMWNWGETLRNVEFGTMNREKEIKLESSG